MSPLRLRPFPDEHGSTDRTKARSPIEYESRNGKERSAPCRLEVPALVYVSNNIRSYRMTPMRLTRQPIKNVSRPLQPRVDDPFVKRAIMFIQQNLDIAGIA